MVTLTTENIDQLCRMFPKVSRGEIELLDPKLAWEALSHPDEVCFIGPDNFRVELMRIVGSYTVYDADHCFLYTVNLHKGIFGETIPEVDFISHMPPYTVLYVTYMDGSNTFRNIMLIWR